MRRAGPLDARLVALVRRQRDVIALQDQELAQVRLEALAQEEASHRALEQLVHAGGSALARRSTRACATAPVLESSASGASEARRWEEEEHRAALAAVREQIATLERTHAAEVSVNREAMARLQCDYEEALAELRTWRSGAATAMATDDARGLAADDDGVVGADAFDSTDSVTNVTTATPVRAPLVVREAEASSAQRGAEGGAMYAAFTAYAQSLIEENLTQKAELERLREHALRTSAAVVEQ